MPRWVAPCEWMLQLNSLALFAWLLLHSGLGVPEIRHDSFVGEKVSEFLRQNQVRSIVVAEGILGCPHEEGIDYPEGKSCPQCRYWAGRDRFTQERIQQISDCRLRPLHKIPPRSRASQNYVPQMRLILDCGCMTRQGK